MNSFSSRSVTRKFFDQNPPTPDQVFNHNNERSTIHQFFSAQQKNQQSINKQQTTSMQFTPKTTSPHTDHPYRTGTLLIHNKTHHTPTCTIHTRRGTIPHLTNDNFDLVLDECGMGSAIIQLNLFDLLHNYPTTLFSPQNNEKSQENSGSNSPPTTNTKTTSLHKFLNFEKHSLLLSIRDPQYPANTQLFNDKFLMGDTESGRKKLSESEFLKTVESLNADLHVMMHDNGYGNGNGEQSSTYNKKRFVKALQRNVNWQKSQNEHYFCKNHHQSEKIGGEKSVAVHGLMQCAVSLEHHAMHLPQSVQSLFSINHKTTTTTTSVVRSDDDDNGGASGEKMENGSNSLPVKAILFGDLTQLSSHDQSIALSNSIRSVLVTAEENKEKLGVASGEHVLRMIQGLDHPLEVLDCVHRGIDVLDATYPFVCSEFGYASIYPLTPDGDRAASVEMGVNGQRILSSDVMKMNLRSVEYVRDFRPISSTCPCWACKNHTRAYIHHLFNTHEMLAEVLLTIHNLYHYLSLFKTIRQQIDDGSFEQYKSQMEKLWTKI